MIAFSCGSIKAETHRLMDIFQGPLACTRIQHGKGVCGSSWARRETIVVENVHQFPGHIGNRVCLER